MTRTSRKRVLLKRLMQTLLLASCVLVSILAINLWRFESRQIQVAVVPTVELDEVQLVERLASAITFKTISEQNPARVDSSEFDRFRSYLEESFPRVHQHLQRYTGADLGDDRNRSLLFEWAGTNMPGQNAILLMAHYDVVPAEAASLDRWTHPPFAGYVDETHLWGRGTLDVKNGAIGLMEAVEHLLDRGFQPHRTIYLSLGHDEEVGGEHGNKPVSQWMRQNGIRLEFVLDEGGCIYESFEGLNRPLALIGIAEKGYLSVRMVVELEDGGHSSTPPRLTAIGILAEALHRLHERPFPSRLDGGAALTLNYIGPEYPLLTRVAMSNCWLFAPLIKRQIGSSPGGNATLRTTLAPTIAKAGVKDNVLPTRAELIINSRILPGDTVASALDHIKRVVADERIEIQTVGFVRNPSRLSSTDSAAFELIHKTIKQIYPTVVVAPYVVVGGTDAAHYDDHSLSKDVYRFIPSRLTAEDLRRVHGIDERIAKQDYLNIVRFYIQLIKNAGV